MILTSLACGLLIHRASCRLFFWWCGREWGGEVGVAKAPQEKKSRHKGLLPSCYWQGDNSLAGQGRSCLKSQREAEALVSRG